MTPRWQPRPYDRPEPADRWLTRIAAPCADPDLARLPRHLRHVLAACRGDPRQHRIDFERIARR